MEDKKSFFEPFCKARLIARNEIKKKLLQPLSVAKEGCQAFSLLFKKAVKFTEAFKYVVISVPLAVTIPKSTPYQSDKSRIKKLHYQSTKKF